MLNRKICILAVVFFAAAALLVAEETKPDKTFMWKVSSENTTIYLLGSAHMAPENIYPLDKAITAAYEASAVVAVEADVRPEKQAGLMQTIQQKAAYADGTTVKDHVSEETYKKLSKWVETTGMSMAQLGMMRPWILSLTVTQLELQKLGYNPQSGIDMHFIKKCVKDKKELKELESVEYQINLLSGFSDELQEKFLLRALNEAENMGEQFEKLLKAWSDGDAAGMEATIMAEVKKTPELKPVYDKLFDERNILMAAKVEEHLKTGKTAFVIVGAGHLVGEKGMVKLLAASEKKYKIEQVKALGRPVKEKAKAEAEPVLTE